jgi:hypothetical protein
MTRRSRQEREPPRFVDLKLLRVNSAFRNFAIKESMLDFRSGQSGECANETINLLRASDPD